MISHFLAYHHRIKASVENAVSIVAPRRMFVANELRGLTPRVWPDRRDMAPALNSNRAMESPILAKYFAKFSS